MAVIVLWLWVGLQRVIVVLPAHTHLLFSLTTCFNNKLVLSYDVASESEITPCIKIDKSLVVYRFSWNIIDEDLTSRIW